MLGAKSGVHQDIPAGSRMLGYPAIPDREQLKIWATMHKLPEMRKEFKTVLRKLEIKEAA
jgi:UDP-3-O-[3-hydroxymyristoyl] glucosamine N-acyltransferase